MRNAKLSSPGGFQDVSGAPQITTLLHKEPSLFAFKLAKKAKHFDMSLSSHFGLLQIKIEFLELDPLSRTLLDLEKEYEEEMK